MEVCWSFNRHGRLDSEQEASLQPTQDAESSGYIRMCPSIHWLVRLNAWRHGSESVYNGEAEVKCKDEGEVKAKSRLMASHISQASTFSLGCRREPSPHSHSLLHVRLNALLACLARLGNTTAAEMKTTPNDLLAGQGSAPCDHHSAYDLSAG